jgi:hypothetical protein
VASTATARVSGLSTSRLAEQYRDQLLRTPTPVEVSPCRPGGSFSSDGFWLAMKPESTKANSCSYGGPNAAMPEKASGARS